MATEETYVEKCLECNEKLFFTSENTFPLNLTCPNCGLMLSIARTEDGFATSSALHVKLPRSGAIASVTTLGKLEMLQQRIREKPLIERLVAARRIVSQLCKEGRPPKMSIPIQHDDEDLFICTTLEDAAEALAVSSDIIQTHVQLPRSGATAHVNSNIAAETVNALDELCLAALASEAGLSVSDFDEGRVVIELSDEQLESIAALYKNKNPETNGGPLFGVLGQAFIDDKVAEHGEAHFYWLSQEQYSTIHDAVMRARFAKPAAADNTTA